MIASDGDLEEGVSGEASSLAGHQQLGNLTVIYDDNKISIEDDTNIAFSEDVAARYEAYGWHVQDVDWTNGGTGYEENVQALYDAIEAANAVTDKPSFIRLHTIIGWPAPTKQNTGKIHGSALGADEVAATKKVLGFDPEQTFEVADDVIAHTRKALDRGKALQDEWDVKFDAWRTAAPERAALFDRLPKRELPDGWEDALPSWDADAKGVATRAASGDVLTKLSPELPELWGGSADLAGSNNTTPKGEPSFIPAEHATKEFQGDEYGRVLHFGIREHAMGSILNGIALHGLTRPYGGTFLVFSDYMRPAVRLAALMKLPVTYVWTHDSIGLGEDGPTHQPVEHLAALRAIPGLDVVRPGDANETAAAWAVILEHTDRPAGLALTRQNVPTFPRGTDGFATTENVKKGGYTLLDTDGTPDVVLIGTGSELQLAVEARDTLAGRGHQGARGLDGLPRVVRRAGRRVPRVRHPGRRSGPGSRSRPASPRAGTTSSATPAARSAWSTTARRPPTRRCTTSSASPPSAVVQAAKDSIAAAAEISGPGVPPKRAAAGPVGPADAGN